MPRSPRAEEGRMALKRINKKSVEDIVTFAWQVFQSFVFGLTGAEIFIISLGFETVGLCLATMILAVAVRIVATLVIGSGFHWKEKLFIRQAWFPKATVQFCQTIPEACMSSKLIFPLVT